MFNFSKKTVLVDFEFKIVGFVQEMNLIWQCLTEKVINSNEREQVIEY